MDNLQIIKQSQEEEIDRSPIKIIFLAIAATALTVITVYFFNAFLLTAAYNKLFLSLFFGGLTASFAVLLTLFVKKMIYIVFIGLLQFTAPLVIFSEFFYNRFFYILLIGALIALLFFISTVGFGLRTVRNSLKIHFFQTAKIIVPRLLTGLIILTSVIFYLNYFKWNKFNEELGQDFVSRVLKSSQPFVKIWFSDFSYDQTVESFLNSLIESKVKNIKIDTDVPINFDRLPEQEKIRFIKELSKTVEENLKKIIGPFDAKQTISQVAYASMKSYFEKFSSQTKTFAGITLALILLFIFKGIYALFYWLIYFISFIIFKFLLVVGFARKSLETTSREFIIL